MPKSPKQIDAKAIAPIAWWAAPHTMARHLSNGKYMTPQHVRLLSEIITRAANTPNSRFVVSMPPRHGKSESLSHWGPVWYLAAFPEKRVMLCSYGSDFAAKYGRRVRNTLISHEKELGIKLAVDSQAAYRWDTTEGGGMYATGIEGALTGKGADLLILDDIIKSREEANSQIMRDKAWEFFRGTAYTRLEPGGSIIAIHTRWHEDDLIGRILADRSERWTNVALPALAEDNDPLGRKPGEALWPERYPVEELERIRRAIGTQEFVAQFQQRPSPAGGGMFRREWFRYFRDAGAHYEFDGKRVLKDRCWRMIVADLALTAKTSADYTVIQVWDVTPDNDMLLVEQWRDRKEAPEVEDQLLSMYRTFKPVWMGVEDAHYGSAVLQRFRRDGIPLRSLKPDKDKITRASIAQVWMENGKVYFQSNASYLDSLERELLVFPHGKHDDQVDCAAYAAQFCNNRSLWVAPPVKSYPPNSMGAILKHEDVLKGSRAGWRAKPVFSLRKTA